MWFYASCFVATVCGFLSIVASCGHPGLHLLCQVNLSQVTDVRSTYFHDNADTLQFDHSDTSREGCKTCNSMNPKWSVPSVTWDTFSFSVIELYTNYHVHQPTAKSSAVVIPHYLIISSNQCVSVSRNIFLSVSLIQYQLRVNLWEKRTQLLRDPQHSQLIAITKRWCRNDSLLIKCLY